MSLADDNDETTEVASFRSESYGIPITFSSPKSREALLDLMVATIRAKDLRTCSTLVICQQNAEARHVKSEMGKRNINTMLLLDADHLTTHNMVRLWSQGYIQQVLIACDDHLNLLEGICVNFVIHTALPPVEKFRERLRMLSKSESKTEMLAFISDGFEDELQSQPQPEMDYAFDEVNYDDMPPLVPIPVDDDLEQASEEASSHRENELLPLEESLLEELELEGWETPPESPTFTLPVDKLTSRLNLLSTLKLSYKFNGLTEKEETEGRPTQPEMDYAFDEVNYDEMPPLVPIPVDDDLEQASEEAWSQRALTQGKESLALGESPPEEPELEGTSKEAWSQRALTQESASLALGESPPEEPEIEGTSKEAWSQRDLTQENESLPLEETPLEEPKLERTSKAAWSQRALTRWSGSLPPEESLSEELDFDWKPRLIEKLTLKFGEPEFIRVTVGPPPSRPSSKYSAGTTRGQSSTGVAAGAAAAAAADFEGKTRTQFGVLVWSRDPIVPCYDISGVPDLHPLIRSTMMTLIVDMKDRPARGIQRYAWPHVASGKSLVAVGPEKIGKTWCFLPGLCQRTHQQILHRPEQLYGPTSIVVCFNQQQGNRILQWIIQLLDPLNTGVRISYKPVVTLWEKGNVKEVADSLRHPVGILVTTPDMLVQLKDLHTEENPILHVNAVKCLVLDNLSDMMRHLPDNTAKMIDWMVKLLDFGPDNCQLFVTTRLWPEILMRETLLHLVPDVLVIFKDPLEATIFQRSNLEVKLIDSGQESRLLVQMLRHKSLCDERIVVVCHTKEKVLSLKDTLAKAQIRAEAIYADNGLSTVNKWRLRPLPLVLLITDDMVNKVNCGPIDQLIHYTPAMSWMRFKFRFSLFYNNYVSSADGNPGKAVVMVHKADFDHLWLLAEFMLWHQLPRPNHWLRVLAESRQMQDKSSLELTKLPLCEHISTYGDCYRRTCRYRHVMWIEEVRPPSNYPMQGDFTFHVLTCNSPTQIAVRLNKVYPTKANFLNTPMSQLGHEIHMFYEIEKNRRQHEKPKVGETVVVRNLNRYERVLIIGMSSRVITVRLLDTGIDVLSYKPGQIFICEEQHQREPGQAMEVRIIGIEPDTLDRIWTKEMRDSVRNSFFTRLPDKRTRIFSAKVKFVLARTIFVETVFNDKGQDLRSYLLDRYHVYEEFKSIEKLVTVVGLSQHIPKDTS